MKALLTPEQFQHVQEKISEAVDKFIEELPSLIHRRLEQSVARVLGFEVDRWKNEWRLRGGSNVLSNLISKKAKDRAKIAIDEIAENFEFGPEFFRAMKFRFTEDFKHAIKEALRKKADRAGAILVDKLFSNFEMAFGDFKEPPPELVFDPNYGKTPTQRAWLEEAIKESINEIVDE